MIRLALAVACVVGAMSLGQTADAGGWRHFRHHRARAVLHRPVYRHHVYRPHVYRHHLRPAVVKVAHPRYVVPVKARHYHYARPVYAVGYYH